MEGLLLVDTSFDPRDSPRPVNRVLPCHPLRLPLAIGVSMIPSIHSLARYARGIRGGEDLEPVKEQEDVVAASHGSMHRTTS